MPVFSALRLKAEKVPLLPSKAPFSKRFEDAVGQTCEWIAATATVGYLAGKKQRNSCPGIEIRV